jgi:hypothetical protein
MHSLPAPGSGSAPQALPCPPQPGNSSTQQTHQPLTRQRYIHCRYGFNPLLLLLLTVPSSSATFSALYSCEALLLLLPLLLTVPLSSSTSFTLHGPISH